MDINFKTIRLTKRVPLAISHAVYDAQDNLFVEITADGLTGIGEMSPGSSEGAATAEEGQNTLAAFWRECPVEAHPQHVYDAGRNAGVPLCALAALDMALWDLLGKRARLPLHSLFGFGTSRVATSVTIGINPPDLVRERVRELLSGPVIRSLKIKLGSPDGIEADKDMMRAVVAETKRQPVSLRVDANGGWNLNDARSMMPWLAEQGVDYVEQPLARGNEDALRELYKTRPLPIFVDESCHISSDIHGFADCVDGINIKLMKCGGLTEALRLIAVARSYNLKTMIGCMSESSVSISAGAAITALLDHVDLDSHLNLAPDPAVGARLEDGVVVPTQDSGHGASLRNVTA